MLKRYERSRYLYENKQNMGKMPGEKSDIYGKPTRFLQKKRYCGDNLRVPCSFLRVFSGIIPSKCEAAGPSLTRKWTW
jgi:hypothetical protein